VLKKLSGLTLQMALRKAAKIMQNAIEEVGITELVSVPKMGKPFFLEDCISTEEAQSGYRKVLESLFLFEAMISYNIADKGEIEHFLRETLESYLQGFASYAKLKIPEWVGPRRNLGVKTILGRYFSVLIPEKRASFSGSFREGDPCVVVAMGGDTENSVRLFYYFGGQLVAEESATSIAIARKVGHRFVKENLV
ncbi:hypothetical protein KKF11_01835, partial [Patescibacteria group bacterium]|nr:hypothetical protein [Patescibacteria group bacterium]